MRFRGAFRVVRHADHAVPERAPRPLAGSGPLEVRFWRRPGGGILLLASASRRQGPAVARNRFRRRVRHAFLALVRDGGVPAGVVWVRPARSGRSLARIPYPEILEQLRRALAPFGGP